MKLFPYADHDAASDADMINAASFPKGSMMFTSGCRHGRGGPGLGSVPFATADAEASAIA